MQKQGRLVIVTVIVVLVVIGMVVGLRMSSSPVEEAIPEVNLDAVQAQMDAGDYVGARDALEQVVASNAEDAEAYFLLGLTYFNLEEYEKARESFVRTLELDSDRSAAVHHNLGVLAYQIGDMETAVAEFKTAIEADANDPDSHYQLGAAYLQMASTTSDVALLAKAEAEFKQVLTLAPGKPEALVGLGTLYMSQNKVVEATTLLEQAVEENPEMREALFALGIAYFSSGETVLAKQTLQRFLDTDPPTRWAEEAQDILAQIVP